MSEKTYVYAAHDDRDVFEFLQTLNTVGARFVSMGTRIGEYEQFGGYIITYEHDTEITE